MKKKQLDIEDVQRSEPEDTGKEKKRRESIEKRKRLKKEDRAARWSGFVLLLCLLIVGFLLWVMGEINAERNKVPVTMPPVSPADRVIIR